MQPDPEFAKRTLAAFDGKMPSKVFFICRSGARSMEAAQLVAAYAAAENLGPVECVNVAEGFEGDKDAGGHRGRMNGWKAHNLPWRQS